MKPVLILSMVSVVIQTFISNISSHASPLFHCYDRSNLFEAHLWLFKQFDHIELHSFCYSPVGMGTLRQDFYGLRGFALIGNCGAEPEQRHCTFNQPRHDVGLTCKGRQLQTKARASSLTNGGSVTKWINPTPSLCFFFLNAPPYLPPNPYFISNPNPNSQKMSRLDTSCWAQAFCFFDQPKKLANQH